MTPTDPTSRQPVPGQGPSEASPATERPSSRDRYLTILGWVATCVSLMMYVSYIPQIQENLHGHKSPWLQPFVAAVNCTLWVIYAMTKKPKRDYPVALANFPGIIFGLLAFLTAL